MRDEDRPHELPYVRPPSRAVRLGRSERLSQMAVYGLLVVAGAVMCVPLAYVLVWPPDWVREPWPLALGCGGVPALWGAVCLFVGVRGLLRLAEGGE